MPRSFITKALKALPANAPAAQKKLLDELSRYIHDEDLGQFDENLFIDMVLAHWEMCKTRKDGQSKVAIYCPITKGQSLRRTVIDVVSDDMAFLVDSVAAEINKSSHLIDLLIHPILYAKYDKNGKIVDFSDKKKDGYITQSHIHIHIKETLSEEALNSLENGLRGMLEDVFIANRDWRAMLDKLKTARDELANAKTRVPARKIEEYCAFLDYLHDNNFTLLGYREYEFVEKNGELRSRTIGGKGLGLLDSDTRPAFISESREGLPRNLQELRRSLPPVSVSKTNRLSTVHRRVPMDAIAVKTYNEKGQVIGEKLFLGLFTSVTYSRSVSDVPYLREKVETVVDMSNFLPGSHDRKAMRHILEKYPRDELFQIPEKELYQITLEILRLQERQRIAMFMRKDLFGRYISCLVYVPRERFGTNLRKQITEILEEELNGECTSFTTSMDDSVFARALFIINVSQKNPPKFSQAEIEVRLQEAGQTWAERLAIALTEFLEDEQQITSLTLRYGEAFPISYTTRYRAKQAVFDINKIEEALDSGRLVLDLYRPEDIDEGHLRLKVYNPGKPITLSDVMPILENMGLRAISELPYEITPANAGASVWIHDFLLQVPEVENADPIVIHDVKEIFERAFTRVWYNEMDSDGLNKLVLRAGMNWHEITILRTYSHYMRQIRIPFSQPYIHTALNQNPKISRLLVTLFKAYHKPENAKKGDKLAVDTTGKIEKALGAVESLDQDRILRTLHNLIEATLRTNYYQRQEDGTSKHYLSIKLDSRQISGLPEPKPFREIFVYSPRVEAIHLRGDKIARGGLRWSDRHEDYRTEVLGLMKAQMVKNAVIVPMGSKGGFVVKKKTRNREEFQAEGIECYKIFIRGLLDITDNLKGSRVIPPRDVVRRDGDDPYLVVAADKGTATFSDIANALSEEYDFWLADAFASGGSAGYDHKKMGITARGAWESVKLHFRQLNHNTQTQPFDVVGIGDMGGDVFGNGMLLSEKIRLIGAFNHLHIFCDPNPDPETGFKERKKLFKNVQGWDHYDTKKLSKGGRIYSRSDKTLTLTPEIMKRFDIDKEKVSPNELIRSLLQARTDLMWFGGIGTYVKSSDETHLQVGDKANDPLRINAAQMRAKVVGEGANLAVTQLGRVEFAEKGGKINTDFIDNSGGVDSSDHEVNIKILLADVMSQPKHKMNVKSRNTLLEKMTDEIAEHVLRNNYQQAQAVSLTELQGRENLKMQDEFIQELEHSIGLNRVLEGLPEQEIIENRLRMGKGMTRPELCILLAYAKIVFTQDLLASKIPDSKNMQYWLSDYFPEVLQKKYSREIGRHKLRREIISMSIANSLVNRMGPTFIKALNKKTGASGADIAQAYIIVREAYELRQLWSAIEALDNKVPAEVQMKAMREIARTAEHAISWFLTRFTGEMKMGRDIRNYGEGIATLRKNIKKLATNELTLGIEQRSQAGERDGLTKETARQIALMPVLSSACDIVRIALQEKTDLLHTGQIYFRVGQEFHLDWLRQQARFINPDDHWQAEALDGLIDKLYSCQAGLTMQILKDENGHDNAVDSWLDTHADRITQSALFFEEIRTIGTIDLPMLIIAEQRLSSLYSV